MTNEIPPSASFNTLSVPDWKADNERSPEIRQRYEWLEENFPGVADRIFIITTGEGETPQSVFKAEEDRLEDLGLKEADEKQLKETFVEQVKTLHDTPAAMPYGMTRHYADGNSFGVIHLPVNGWATRPELLDPVSTALFPADKQDWRNMFKVYVADQESIHVVDGLTNRSTYADDTGNFSATGSVKFEAVGEMFSVLSLMQRAQKGEFSGPVDPFLDRIKLWQQGTLFRHDTAGGHSMVDEAIDMARQWGRDNGGRLKDMTPQEMLETARLLTNSLPLPSEKELDGLRRRTSRYLPWGEGALGLSHLPSATEAEVLDNISHAADSPWERRQFKQAVEAVKTLHDPSHPRMPDQCWPEGEGISKKPVGLTPTSALQEEKDMVGEIQVPFRKGQMVPAVPCTSKPGMKP